MDPKEIPLKSAVLYSWNKGISVFVVVIRLCISLFFLCPPFAPDLSAGQITAEVSIPELRLYPPVMSVRLCFRSAVPASPDGQL